MFMKRIGQILYFIYVYVAMNTKKCSFWIFSHLMKNHKSLKHISQYIALMHKQKKEKTKKMSIVTPKAQKYTVILNTQLHGM